MKRDHVDGNQRSHKLLIWFGLIGCFLSLPLVQHSTCLCVGISLFYLHRFVVLSDVGVLLLKI